MDKKLLSNIPISNLWNNQIQFFLDKNIKKLKNLGNSFFFNEIDQFSSFDQIMYNFFNLTTIVKEEKLKLSIVELDNELLRIEYRWKSNLNFDISDFYQSISSLINNKNFSIMKNYPKKNEEDPIILICLNDFEYLFGYNYKENIFYQQNCKINEEKNQIFAYQIKTSIQNLYSIILISSLLSTIFQPFLKFSTILNQNLYLINIPKLSENNYDIGVKERIKIFCNSILNSEISFICSHHCESHELNCFSDTIICQINSPKESKLYLYCFFDSIPINDINMDFSMKLVNNISWSSLGINLLPLEDYYPKKINFSNVPYCFVSKIIGQIGSSIVLFLNTSRIDITSVSQKAIESVFLEFKNVCPSFFRRCIIHEPLLKIFSIIPSIENSILNILDSNITKEENEIFLNRGIWNKFCRILEKNINEKRKLQKTKF